MTTYIAMLRGINVSGQKLIKMEALKKMLESLPFSNVQTFIQSGNIIFQASTQDNDALQANISAQILKTFGFEVPVLVLKTNELKDIIAKNPFSKEDAKDSSHLYVTFLSTKPVMDNWEAILAKRLPGEELVVVDKAVYLYLPAGAGNTKLSNAFLESKLKAVATTRNWKTTLELLKMAENS
jgi:uncharacterized protein (DUF1697 family)